LAEEFTENGERSKSGILRTVSAESPSLWFQSGFKCNFGEGARSLDA
jgi:hypothetical protein